jgi:N6-L-threonylcarbamoyladenine synthase
MKGDLDFSFSGLKTAVLRHVRQRPDSAWPMSERAINDICASFQRVVVTTLIDRLFEAAARYGAQSVGIAGGVSANARLRADAAARGTRAGLPVYVPHLSLSTDNAAMIAAAGLRNFRAGKRAGLDLNADASMEL